MRIITITLASLAAISSARGASINERNVLEAGMCTDCANGRAPSPFLEKVYMYGVGENGKIWDSRIQKLPSELGPARAIGRLEATFERKGKKAIARATAFLISPCHVLTSMHATSAWQINKEWDTMNFKIGDHLEDVTAARRIPGAHGQVQIRGKVISGCQDDWEVLRLDRCVGDDFGYLPLARLSNQELRMKGARNPGYPKDFDETKGMALDRQCYVGGVVRVVGTKTEEGVMTCTSQEGNSGGPILERSSYPRAIGLVCGITGNKPFYQPQSDVNHGVANLMTLIGPIYPEIARIVSSPEESGYIRSHANTAPPVFGETESSGGRWQTPGSGAPPVPDIRLTSRDWPDGWEPNIEGASAW